MMPAYKKRRDPEHQMCKEIMTFVRLNERRWPCLRWFFHVSNEGKRNPWKAAEIGIKAGVSDYHLPVPTDQYRGLWLEIKDKGKKPTQAQARWLEDMRSIGHQAEWCDTLQSAFLIIETYAKEAHELYLKNGKNYNHTVSPPNIV